MRYKLLFLLLAAIVSAFALACADDASSGGGPVLNTVLDTDNDGVVARGEWRGRPSVFDALDTNRNGVLSRDEYVRGSARNVLTKQ